MSANAYAVTDPMTGAVRAQYPIATDADIESALAAADTAGRAWSAEASVQQRADLLRAVGDLHIERRDELADIIVGEMGKPIGQARGEVEFSADIYRYYAGIAAEVMADEPITLLSGTGRAFIRRAPLGTLLGIMPWNYPYYQVARFAGANLVAGNRILLKHAPQCPASAAAIEDIFRAAGFPAGVYTNIYATNDQAARIIADPRVHGVSLTGSERAGSAVAEIAGRHLKKVVLELGGSDPFILLSTDDLDSVVTAAVNARISNSGQVCNGAKRFIVADGLYDEFLTKFVDALTQIRPGDPTEEGTRLGPLSSVAAADRLEGQITRAVQQGARIALNGQRIGNGFAPVVLTDVAPGTDAYREEFFGPVAAVYRVGSEAEALQLANDTPYGLGSYVFTTDPDQALRMADGLEVGMVFVNGVSADGVELPFGGVKRSGIGREMGRLGVEEFVNKKLIRVIT